MCYQSCVVPPGHVTSELHNKRVRFTQSWWGWTPLTRRKELPKKFSLPSQHSRPGRPWFCLLWVPLRTMLLSQEIYNNYLLSKIHRFTKNPMDVIFFNFQIVVVEMIICLFFFPFSGGFSRLQFSTSFCQTLVTTG